MPSSLSSLSSQRLPIFYATRDGHSRRIAERIAGRVTVAGVEAVPVNVAVPPASGVLAALPCVVLVAAIRYGRPLPEAEVLLDVYATLETPPPLALASVNLTARKVGKCTPQTNPCLRKWITRRRLAPDLAVAIAGRLDYPRYRLFDRLAIQFIMALTGGPTDPATQVDYTDWNGVDAFATNIVASTLQPRPAR